MNDKKKAPQYNTACDRAVSTLDVLEAEEVSLVLVLGFLTLLAL
jgi:hypothetical protein